MLGLHVVHAISPKKNQQSFLVFDNTPVNHLFWITMRLKLHLCCKNVSKNHILYLCLLVIYCLF